MSGARQILGYKHRGVRIDRQTRQSIPTAKHVGDVEYDLIGDTAISEKSRFKVPTRETTLNPVVQANLNEVGQNADQFNRIQKSRTRKI